MSLGLVRRFEENEGMLLEGVVFPQAQTQISAS